MIKIPESECVFTFSRSGGAGGQNVNKVSTKVTLVWDPRSSRVLSETQKQLLLQSPVVAARITPDGTISITWQTERSQARNRELALEKLDSLVQEALKTRKKRKKTRVSTGQKEKRLGAKRKRSLALSERRWPVDR